MDATSVQGVTVADLTESPGPLSSPSPPGAAPLSASEDAERKDGSWKQNMVSRPEWAFKEMYLKGPSTWWRQLTFLRLDDLPGLYLHFSLVYSSPEFPSYI